MSADAGPRFERVMSLFRAASSLPPSEWRTFLAAQPGVDPALADEVAVLLAGARSDELDTLLSRVRASATEAARLVPVTHPERIGNYEIREEIGSGGMGTVYLAVQTEPVRRQVALKVIKLGMDSRAVLARFEHERQALALMQHDGIARVFECGTTPQGQPYFVMEYVPGVPLNEYCDRNALPLAKRLTLMLQVCAAVAHAHQKGVIHRDLKPGNVLVTEVSGEVRVKIIDFGLAKVMSHDPASRFTEVGQVVGTPEYMAPEQADPAQGAADTRTDIYALGVMLYELAVGVLPFAAARLRDANTTGFARLLRDQDPPRPSVRFSQLSDAQALAARRGTTTRSLRRALRVDLDWVILKAMRPEPGARYAAATLLADDLQRYLDQQPVAACPPSAVYQLRKFVRRHRTGVAVAAAALVAACIGIGFDARWRRERQERLQQLMARATQVLHRVESMQTDRPWPNARLREAVTEAHGAAQAAEAASGTSAGQEIRAAAAAALTAAASWQRDLTFADAIDRVSYRSTFGSEMAKNRRRAEDYSELLRRYGVDLGAEAGPAWLDQTARVIETSRIRSRLLQALIQVRVTSGTLRSAGNYERCGALLGRCCSAPMRVLYTENWAGRGDEARIALANAAPLVTDPVEAANLALDLQQYDLAPVADTMLDRLLTKHPDHADLLFARARIAERQLSPAARVELLRAALAADAENRICWTLYARLLVQERSARAQTVLDEALARFPDDPSLSFFRGRWLRENGDSAAARDCFTKVVVHEPAFAEAWMQLVELEGDEGEQLRLLQGGARHDPWFAALAIPLGQRLVAAGEHAEAESALLPLLGSEWRNAKVHESLAAAMTGLGKHDRAALHWRVLTQLGARTRMVDEAESLLRAGEASQASELALRAWAEWRDNAVLVDRCWQVVATAAGSQQPADRERMAAALSGSMPGAATLSHRVQAALAARHDLRAAAEHWLAHFDAGSAVTSWDRLDAVASLLHASVGMADPQWEQRAWSLAADAVDQLRQRSRSSDPGARVMAFLEAQLWTDREPLKSRFAALLWARRRRGPLPANAEPALAVVDGLLQIRDASRPQ